MSAETDKIAAKIRALLAKAEGTAFPEEAHALTAKAQELMLRYSIEAHQVRLIEHATEVPITRTYYIPNPHGRSWLALCACVAQANSVASVQSAHKVALLDEDVETFPRPGVVPSNDPSINRGLHFTGYLVYLTGFASDLDAVWALYGSLHIQAKREVHLTPHPGIHGKTWATSFFSGYAGEISRILRAARQTVVEESGGSFLPAILNKEQQVEAAKRKAFPHLTRMGPSVRSLQGVIAGQRAAQRADVGRSRLGSTRALPR